MDEMPQESGPGSHDPSGPAGAASPPRSWRTWQLIVAVVVVAVLAAAVAFAAGRNRDANEQVSTATSESPGPSPNSDAGTTSLPGTGYTPPPQTAARDLDGFLSRATSADRAWSDADQRLDHGLGDHL
jgi:hypothetical protein